MLYELVAVAAGSTCSATGAAVTGDASIPKTELKMAALTTTVDTTPKGTLAARRELLLCGGTPNMQPDDSRRRTSCTTAHACTGIYATAPADVTSRAMKLSMMIYYSGDFHADVQRVADLEVGRARRGVGT